MRHYRLDRGYVNISLESYEEDVIDGHDRSSGIFQAGPISIDLSLVGEYGVDDLTLATGGVG